MKIFWRGVSGIFAVVCILMWSAGSVCLGSCSKDDPAEKEISHRPGNGSGEDDNGGSSSGNGENGSDNSGENGTGNSENGSDNGSGNGSSNGENGSGNGSSNSENGGSGNQDEEVAAIVGSWVDASGKSKLSFGKTDEFAQYTYNSASASWELYGKGVYTYSDLKEWLWVSTDNGEEVVMTEYRCKIADDHMTLTTMKGAKTKYTKQN